MNPLFEKIILKLLSIGDKAIVEHYRRISLRDCKSYQLPIYIHGKVRFTSFTTIGTNCHFNGLIIFGKGNVVIKDNFHSGSDCKIITEFHNYMGEKLPYDETVIRRDVIIGKNVWLGQNVTILAGVHIGDGAIIQAGSVVVSNIPTCGIAGGHPAVVFKYRDQEHYTRLDTNEAYH